MTGVAADAGAELLPDPWLGALLERPAWRLELGSGEGLGPLLAELGDGPSFVTAKVPTDRVSDVHVLEAAGFGVVDTAIRLRREGIAGLPDGGEGIDWATASDEPGVVGVARTAFHSSRFHLDPRLPDAAAGQVKAAWAAGWFRGDRGDAMVVARDGMDPVGFLQLLTQGDVLVIDLIGVAVERRSIGLGARMIGFAATSLKPAWLDVGTQAANVGSLRFYEQIGFRVASSSYVLHRHGGCHANR